MNARVAMKYLPVALTLAAIAAFFLLAPAEAPVAGDYGHAHLHDDHGAGAPMTEEAMARWVREYYETNPIVRPASATGEPVATFRALSTTYDLIGSPAGSTVDTAYIMVGETVRWQRLIGSHTLTSGEGAEDPEAGALFDVPIDPNNTVFDYTFNEPGYFPFFCIPHEEFNMRGAVIVEAPVGVTPVSGAAGALGFASDPSPNPTQAGAVFRFALREAGRARALVLDASGRRVADLLDQELEAGTYGAAWDGRDQLGRPARPGVYFVQLSLPGHQSARRVVVAQ
jgi:plastocyanin